MAIRTVLSLSDYRLKLSRILLLGPFLCLFGQILLVFGFQGNDLFLKLIALVPNGTKIFPQNT